MYRRLMSRGLLTEMERKALTGEIEDANQRSTYVARVRNRLENRVAEDVQVLATHQPEMFTLLCEQVETAKRKTE